MGLFDWLGRRRPAGAASPIVWQVARQGDELIVADGRGNSHQVSMRGARFVRVVPLTGVQTHVVPQTQGWQVAVSQPDGDVLVGPPHGDWRTALELARLICERAELPLEPTTEKMFSRVGQFKAPPSRQ